MLQTIGKSPLSERVQLLSESETLAMAKKSRELAAKGFDIINLTLGEPDFQTPQHIKDAAKKAIDDGFTFYPPVAGFMDLRKAIAEKLKNENGLKWEAENVIVSTGAKQSLANIFQSILNKGDEVIILAPYWVSYKELVKMAEGTPVYLTASIENGFKTTAAELEAAITPNTKAILYSSPSNPTGAVYTKSELKALADVIAQHEQIYVVADEIYEHISYVEEGYFSMGAFENIANRVITVNGFSKGFAMTGWRLGYMAAEKSIADACEKIQGQVTSGACSVTQRAALAAITGDLKPTFEMKAAYLRRRDLLLKLMEDIKGFKNSKPEGAFYLFPDVSVYFGKKDGDTVIKDSNDLCMYLLNKAHVSTVAGVAFGAPNNIRLSYATSDEKLVEAVKRMKEKLDLLS